MAVFPAVPARPAPAAPRPGTRDFATAVEDRLREFFASRRTLIGTMGPVVVDSAEQLEEFVLRGGKRTRPSFAWVGWLGAGGAPHGPAADATFTACAALELIQAGALIHDDIIDASHTRRGHPTVHMAFQRRHDERGWFGEAGRYGRSAGILLGDLALAWADDMLHSAGITAATTQRAYPVWAAMRTEMIGGQVLDVHNEVSGDESVAAALRVNRYKTAAYTIERPLHLGAALAHADEALITAYRQFGTDIGVAFQLRDDLLGVFGDPAITGKPSGDDLREGKRTVLVAETLRRVTREDPVAAANLRRGLGTDLNAARLEELRALMLDSGAVDAVEARITHLTDRALATLHTSGATPEASEQLRIMALSATQRST